jgi:DNA-binding transcriptional MerR regulator
MQTVYSTTAAARMLDMNPARLKRWLDFGYFEPDFRAVVGSGNYRLFSEEDIRILREILGRIGEGIPLGKALDNRGK